MNIRCCKGDCKFNQGGACYADDVVVCRSANCETYQQDQSKVDLEMATALTPSVPNNVPLSCQAQICLYNHDCRCVANGIAVIDNEEKNLADCATFIER